MGERFADDGRALQWCVEHDVHLLITPVPNSMEPFWVTLWDDRSIRRWRCTVVREAIGKFAAVAKGVSDKRR